MVPVPHGAVGVVTSISSVVKLFTVNPMTPKPALNASAPEIVEELVNQRV